MWETCKSQLRCRLTPHDATWNSTQLHLHWKQVNSPHLIGRFWFKERESKTPWRCFIFLTPASMKTVSLLLLEYPRLTLTDWSVSVSFRWLSVGFVSLIRSDCDSDWQVMCHFSKFFLELLFNFRQGGKKLLLISDMFFLPYFTHQRCTFMSGKLRSESICHGGLNWTVGSDNQELCVHLIKTQSYTSCLIGVTVPYCVNSGLKPQVKCTRFFLIYMTF